MTALLLIFFQSFLIPSDDRIEIIIPTVEEETAYVWRTIMDISFFEEHNYQISLPKGAFIEALKEKAKQNKLTDSEYESLLNFMKEHVYQRSDYKQGFDKISANKSLINTMIKDFEKLEKNWEYNAFEKYSIKLTLYGPGGSYDPEAGSILIYTTKDGKFKQYEEPSNTIIHEIIHIGTENSIMVKHQVSHPLKERIIDKVVMIMFSEYLPDYHLQGFGDSRIDPYLKNKEDIQNLSQKVAEFQMIHLKN